MTAQVGSDYIPVPTQNSIRKFEMNKGLFEFSLKMNDFSQWKMMFSIPEIKEDEQANLILALHWGVNSSSYDKFMKCLILPAFDQNKYLIVAPDAERQPWWVSPKKDQLIALIKGIKKHWPVNKVIVAGYSDGGTGSIQMGVIAPELFDAVIGIAGNYQPINKIDVPSYVIHGVGDQLFSYQRTKNIMEEIKKNNPDVEFITSKELTHYDGCEYVPYLKEAIKWVELKLDL
jgi:pimeloyl-ACP methyl ester carboxylesterase